MVSGTYQKFHAVHHVRLRAVRRLMAMLFAACVMTTPRTHAADCAGDDASPLTLHADYGDGARFRGIRLLGSVRLHPRQVDGFAVHGLSGLAWSPSERRLYAVSDLGFLLHLVPHLRDGHLVGASYCAAFALRDEGGAALRGRWRDAEGLSLRPAAASAAEELLVSFEQHPRVLRYRPDGHYLGALTLPAMLGDVRHNASPNRALEALTETRRHGVVVAPELPLAVAPNAGTPLFELSGRLGAFHSLDKYYSGLVGMATMPDDNLLILERRYISPFQPLIIALSRVTLPARRGEALGQSEIARFDTTAGWAMDNFESVARHEGNRYFMISDDNDSALQHTLLVYFEVLDENAAPQPGDLPKPPLSRHPL